MTKQNIEGILSDAAGPLYQVVNVVKGGSRVLDIGAGNGLLPLLFQHAKKNVIIDGIEPSPEAAKIAHSSYRHFYTGYAQDHLDKIRSNKYDYIILADVIEHIINPELFLRELINATGKKTRIVISTPNVAFASVRLALLDGKFEYVNSGLLEKTHLRFFTKELIEEMIKELDIGVETVKFLQRRFDQTEIPVSIRRNIILLPRLLKDDMAATYQFFFVLSPDSKVRSLDDGEYVGTKFQLRNLVRKG